MAIIQRVLINHQTRSHCCEKLVYYAKRQKFDAHKTTKHRKYVLFLSISYSHLHAFLQYSKDHRIIIQTTMNFWWRHYRAFIYLPYFIIHKISVNKTVIMIWVLNRISNKHIKWQYAYVQPNCQKVRIRAVNRA